MKRVASFYTGAHEKCTFWRPYTPQSDWYLRLKNHRPWTNTQFGHIDIYKVEKFTSEGICLFLDIDQYDFGVNFKNFFQMDVWK